MVRSVDDKARRQQLLDEIREIADLMRECDLAEVALEEGKESRKLTVRRGVVASTVAVSAPPSSPSASAPAKSAVESPTTLSKGGEEIRSPIPGTFYGAPRPGDPPFVAVGDTVEPGQVLCIVEAMKLMNEVEAEFPCEILEILVEDATLVGYGQPLFRVRRT